MTTDFDAQIIPYYSPITSRGGRRRKNRRYRTRKNKKSNKSRTRRHH